MAIEAKTIRVDGAERYDFGGVDVVYWVGVEAEDDYVEVMCDDDDGYSLRGAVRVAAAIKRIVAWSKGRAGKKKIATLRAKGGA